jgi:hypothetical protein
MKGAEAFLKGRKPGLFVNFGQFPFFWILIRIPNTDPDKGQLNECGSGSTTLPEGSAFHRTWRKHFIYG